MFLLHLFAKSILSMKSTRVGCMHESGWLLHCVVEVVGIYEELKQACRKTVTDETQKRFFIMIVIKWMKT
jgi:hypothetical protein